MTTETTPPFWMHELVTAEQYDSWPDDQCNSIEIMDGMVVMSPSPSDRHNWVGTLLAVALTSAGGSQWRAGTDFDVRLRDVPLLNRRPDVVVFRADTFGTMPKRPEHVLLIAEVVSPGSESADRKIKPDEYAAAGIEYYWRVEQVGIGIPVVHTYVLDAAAQVYRPTEVFTGVVRAIAPFAVELDLREI
jgi:Uma2 family endonuclease